MKQRTDIPKEIYQDEIVCFLAERYHTTSREILQQFFKQNHHHSEMTTPKFRLEENEMTILQEMIDNNHM